MADHKAEIANAETVGFGKVIFFSPGLPDMNLIVFRKKYGYQIICIDIYVDATGESLQEARKNFSLALNTHIKQTFEAHNGNEKAAIKDIVQVAYDKGDIKSLYFDKYRQAKHRGFIRADSMQLARLFDLGILDHKLLASCLVTF